MDNTFTKLLKLIVGVFAILLVSGIEKALAQAPEITSFEPETGPTGTYVTIYGNNLTTVDKVFFADEKQVTNIQIVDDHKIIAQVPYGANTGKITLTKSTGEKIQTTKPFTVTFSISSISPTAGPAGTLISIDGTGFTENFEVTFTGSYGPIETDINDNKFISHNRVQTKVPISAQEGTYVVTITVNGISTEGTQRYTVTEETILPVKFISFSAQPFSSGVSLTWQTASEKNNDYFEVQSSSNPVKESFKTVKRLNSQSTNSQVPLLYQTEDLTPAKGPVTYYRLKQVDLDGAFEYSKVIAVATKHHTSTSTKIKAYPNPFTKEHSLNVEVQTSETGEITASLYDLMGNKVTEASLHVEAGHSTLDLPLPGTLKPSLYILKTNLNGHTSSISVVKR
ncbi:IPT/TIG domain-containing protein [Sabulibacter ruber]|uniref:IPT/TIG domain-containing protein n=1 Tax=Sabulibacter ruber TaxID=2811901 RepID=UPI001A964CD7|nr:IPT/TIG domain-containing protein [Sabulibacter ruber]